jgi:hypothetical protein
MQRIVLVAIVLLAMGVAQAGPVTLQDTVTDLANFGSDGLYFLPDGTNPHTQPYYRYFWQDWTWDQAVTYLTDPSPDASGVRTLESGSLTVYAWQADEADSIIADGTALGNLQSPPPGLPDQWTTKTFNLAAILADLEDGMLDMAIDIDTGEAGSGVTLGWSQLSVTYRWDWVVQDEEDGDDDGGPVVPVPGALVLAGIGTALVGWLRKYQSR